MDGAESGRGLLSSPQLLGHMPRTGAPSRSRLGQFVRLPAIPAAPGRALRSSSLDSTGREGAQASHSSLTHSREKGLLTGIKASLFWRAGLALWRRRLETQTTGGSSASKRAPCTPPHFLRCDRLPVAERRAPAISSTPPLGFGIQEQAAGPGTSLLAQQGSKLSASAAAAAPLLGGGHFQAQAPPHLSLRTDPAQRDRDCWPGQSQKGAKPAQSQADHQKQATRAITGPCSHRLAATRATALAKRCPLATLAAPAPRWWLPSPPPAQGLPQTRRAWRPASLRCGA